MTRHWYAFAHTYAGNMRGPEGRMIGTVYAFDRRIARDAWVAQHDLPTEAGWRQELPTHWRTFRHVKRLDDAYGEVIIWHAEAYLAEMARLWEDELWEAEVDEPEVIP
jgi:hypothetical protein